MAETPAQTAEAQAITDASADVSQASRLLAQRSHEKRRENKRLAAETDSKIAQQQATTSISVAQFAAQNNEELIRARAQLVVANSEWDQAMKDQGATWQDRERASRVLSTAREDVRKLAGIPLPGNRRPGPERAPRSAPVVPLD